MTREIVIKVDNIRKSFQLPHQKQNSIKGVVLNLFKKKKTIENQEVLKGISFDVKKGEFLGIVGRNGGGKSTTLKLLAQIYQPDSGSITINGDLTPFIELGVGFNPELTGRENVYLNGALLGFTSKQMDAMYDGIVSFAELERFMDQKLKNYSSGMQVRLAFSVAIKARTDILLIDEVLAVGDANFQKKCFDVFEQFKAEGRTVVFISHSMAQVVRFCDRAILLNQGEIVASGDPEIVAFEYDMLNSEDQKNNTDRIEARTTREAQIVEDVLRIFKKDHKLLEIGAGKGRIPEIVNSLNIPMHGLDSIDGSKSGVVKKSILDIKNINDVTGAVITDNLKSFPESYRQFTKLLDEGRAPNLKTIYIHLPFHIYQEHVKESQPDAFSHQAKPFDALSIIDTLNGYGFSLVEASSYGEEAYQYRTFVLRRFDDDLRTMLWESSKA